MIAQTVQIGQIWQDNDPRINPRRRLLRITEVTDSAAHAITWYETQQDGAWVRTSAERPTRVRLDRLKPTSTGYRLIAEAQR